MDVLREITEFYYRKGERDCRWGLCQVECRCHMQGKKKGEDFILGCFYIILNLNVRRKSMSLLSNGLLARGRICADSCIHIC
jgi:hypothetical protein